MSTDMQHDEAWIQNALSSYEITDDDSVSEIEGEVIAWLMRSYAKHMLTAVYEAGRMASEGEIPLPEFKSRTPVRLKITSGTGDEPQTNTQQPGEQL